MPKPVAALLAVTLLATPAVAEPTATVIHHGEVTAVDIGPMAPGDSLQALSEGRTVSQMTFISETDTVEAALCKRFGVSIQIAYAPGDRRISRVLVRVIHPTMHRPDGATGNEDTFYSEPSGDVVGTAFTFDYGWEMEPGRWTWEFSAGSQILATQSFEVTLPDTPEHPRTSCEGPPLS